MRVGGIIDEIPTVAAAAPAQIEMEHVVIIVAIAHKSVATSILTTAVIHRPSHVELFAHHSLPSFCFKVIASELHDSVAIVKILIHHTWNRT